MNRPLLPHERLARFEKKLRVGRVVSFITSAVLFLWGVALVINVEYPNVVSFRFYDPLSLANYSGPVLIAISLLIYVYSWQLVGEYLEILHSPIKKYFWASFDRISYNFLGITKWVDGHLVSLSECEEMSDAIVMIAEVDSHHINKYVNQKPIKVRARVHPKTKKIRFIETSQELLFVGKSGFPAVISKY